MQQLGLPSPSITRWHAEIALAVLDSAAPDEFDERSATRFHLDIYSEEWGVFFCHGGGASWIRITDIAFVHGRDDHRLLEIVPALRDVGSLLRRLEQVHNLKFRRDHASVRTNLPNAEAAIRSWLAAL